MPLYVHTPWLAEEASLAAVKRFIADVAAKEHVYFITMRQLLAWMQAPIAAEQLTPAKLGCGNAGGAGPTLEQLQQGGVPAVAGGGVSTFAAPGTTAVEPATEEPQA